MEGKLEARRRTQRLAARNRWSERGKGAREGSRRRRRRRGDLQTEGEDRHFDREMQQGEIMNMQSDKSGFVCDTLCPQLYYLSVSFNFF